MHRLKDMHRFMAVVENIVKSDIKKPHIYDKWVQHKFNLIQMQSTV